MQRRPGEDPKIGPYSLDVPPPSLNGSSVDHTPPFDWARRAVPGFVIALVLALSAVPQVALLRSTDMQQWWRVLIVAIAGGVVTGAAQKKSPAVAAGLGAAAVAISLLAAYAIVQERQVSSAGPSTIAGNVAMILAWSAVAGGAGGWAGRAASKLAGKKAEARAVKPTLN